MGVGRKKRERKKRYIDLKGRNKTLFTNDLIVYIDYPLPSENKILELIREDSKVTEHKINI